MLTLYKKKAISVSSPKCKYSDLLRLMTFYILLHSICAESEEASVELQKWAVKSYFCFINKWVEFLAFSHAKLGLMDHLWDFNCVSSYLGLTEWKRIFLWIYYYCTDLFSICIFIFLLSSTERKERLEDLLCCSQRHDPVSAEGTCFPSCSYHLATNIIARCLYMENYNRFKSPTQIKMLI